jgi:DNA-binding XRE family transcriptional regulator
MRFRHLDYPPDTVVTDLGPAALDALLERGDLESLAPLLRTVARDPWGPLAETVLRLCEAHPTYGTSVLWRSWIERRRRGEAVGGTTLAEARVRADLTQSDVGQRMGVSQSDVSKLERRDDLLLSTLQRYVEAIGGRLELRLKGADETSSRPLLIGKRNPTPLP